jgi:chemotaxis protein methyltransferase CheR
VVRLERLATLVETVSGIVFSAGQLVHLRELVTRRAAALGHPDLSSYLLALEQGRLENEWRVLLPAITVKESYLFRIPQQFRALQDRLLPELVRARRVGTQAGELRLWSAGCANGEEPATLAVVLAESGLPPTSWTILATDVDERALQQAATGTFSARAVSQVPPELLRRHFASCHGGWALDPSLLGRISFVRLNLVSEPFPDLGPPFDLVLLRNVLIYFRPQSQRRVVEAVARRLSPAGYLFLGHSETLWQLSGRLAPVDLGGCFAYRQAVAPSSTPGRARVDVAVAATGAPPPALPRPKSAPPAAAVPRAAARTPAADEPPLAGAVAALAANRIAVAREIVARRLADEPADAAAHALGGLIHDLQGDGDGAICAYRAALFLRPELYRVRFQLAERLRRPACRTTPTSYRTSRACFPSTRGRSPNVAGLPCRSSDRAVKWEPRRCALRHPLVLGPVVDLLHPHSRCDSVSAGGNLHDAPAFPLAGPSCR